MALSSGAATSAGGITAALAPDDDASPFSSSFLSSAAGAAASPEFTAGALYERYAALGLHLPEENFLALLKDAKVNIGELSSSSLSKSGMKMRGTLDFLAGRLFERFAASSGAKREGGVAQRSSRSHQFTERSLQRMLAAIGALREFDDTDEHEKNVISTFAAGRAFERYAQQGAAATGLKAAQFQKFARDAKIKPAIAAFGADYFRDNETGVEFGWSSAAPASAPAAASRSRFPVQVPPAAANENRQEKHASVGTSMDPDVEEMSRLRALWDKRTREMHWLQQQEAAYREEAIAEHALHEQLPEAFDPLKARALRGSLKEVEKKKAACSVALMRLGKSLRRLDAKIEMKASSSGMPFRHRHPHHYYNIMPR